MEPFFVGGIVIDRHAARQAAIGAFDDGISVLVLFARTRD